MSQPENFTWVEKPHLAAMARPQSEGELNWLRKQGLELLISLTEDPPRRDWINSAGLFLLHVPIMDMEPPTLEQIDQCITTMARAHEQGRGVAVHCGAGYGRTGTILACYFVTKGMNAKNAIARVRRLRPGSVETEEQSQAIENFASHFGKGK
jgi:atypical dual specificity phosphatase